MKIKIIILVIVIAAGGFAWWHFSRPAKTVSADKVQAQTVQKPEKKASKPKAKKVARTVDTAATVKPASSPQTASCSNNTHSKEVIVSLSQQHMWACSGASQVYSTDVTTGAYKIGDGTPIGTWQIYSKQTNRYLTGPGYKDFVKYWMPYNGPYGFHDASWQDFPFGDLQKYGSQGSHGCVHLPDAAAAWMYSWAQIGTTVTIQS